MNDLRVYPDAASLARAAAEHFVTLATAAIVARGQFVVALSGGSTPRATYTLLASDEFAARVDWPRVHVFWGDERCVPPDHSDSNYRMARETMLDKIPIPAENVHRIRGELPPDQAATAYQAELEAAALHEQTRWVVAHYVDKLSAWRVTLTPVAINAAAHVTFVVSGAGKAERLRGVLYGPHQPDVLPAKIVRPTDGRLLWLADTAAAVHVRA